MFSSSYKYTCKKIVPFSSVKKETREGDKVVGSSAIGGLESVVGAVMDGGGGFLDTGGFVDVTFSVVTA